MPSSCGLGYKRSENMSTCSNALFRALLDEGRTRVAVGLGHTAATLDIDTFAWTRSEDPREEEGERVWRPIPENDAASEGQESGRCHDCLLFDAPCLSLRSEILRRLWTGDMVSAPVVPDTALAREHREVLELHRHWLSNLRRRRYFRRLHHGSGQLSDKIVFIRLHMLLWSISQVSWSRLNNILVVPKDYHWAPIRATGFATSSCAVRWTSHRTPAQGDRRPGWRALENASGS